MNCPAQRARASRWCWRRDSLEVNRETRTFEVVVPALPQRTYASLSMRTRCCWPCLKVNGEGLPRSGMLWGCSDTGVFPPYSVDTDVRRTRPTHSALPWACPLQERWLYPSTLLLSIFPFLPPPLFCTIWRRIPKALCVPFSFTWPAYYFSCSSRR